jgi:hypothetical protein
VQSRSFGRALMCPADCLAQSLHQIQLAQGVEAGIGIVLPSGVNAASTKTTPAGSDGPIFLNNSRRPLARSTRITRSALVGVLDSHSAEDVPPPFNSSY